MKFLLPHLGLGDSIILSGAAVALANKHDGLVFPCWKRNVASIQSLFHFHPNIMVLPVESEDDMLHLAKLHEDAGVLRAGHYSGIPRNLPDPQPNEDDFFIGYSEEDEEKQEENYLAALKDWEKKHEGFVHERFDEWLYRTLEVPFPARWASSPISLAATVVEQTTFPENLPFVHDDMARGFPIPWNPNKPLPRRHIRPNPDLKKSILSYVDLLEKAPEIHLINSSFCHLVESINPTGTLYLYANARRGESRDLPFTRKPWNVVW